MKDAYWFPHDSNAHGDGKCVRLRRIMGWEGYGLYWGLIEKLRDAAGYRLPVAILEDLAYEFHIEFPKLQDIVNSDLFQKDEDHFRSDSLIRRMARMDAARERNAEKGRKSAERRKKPESVQPESNRSSTPVQPQLNTSSTDVELGQDRIGQDRTREDSKPAAAKKSSSRKPKEIDAAFIAEMKAAFPEIDVDAELLKMDGWLKTPKGKGKARSQQRFFNWLGRAKPSEKKEGESEFPPGCFTEGPCKGLSY